MNMTKNMISIFGLTLVLATGVALAQIPDFDLLDRNGDGLVDADEARALPCLATNFDRIAKDRAEGLSRGEFALAVREYCIEE